MIHKTSNLALQQLRHSIRHLDNALKHRIRPFVKAELGGIRKQLVEIYKQEETHANKEIKNVG